MPIDHETGHAPAGPDAGLIRRLDDFELIARRQRLMAALAALTDEYRELNQEISRRESLRWMLAR